MRSNYSQEQVMHVDGALAERLQGAISGPDLAIMGLDAVVTSNRLDFLVASAQSVMKELDTNETKLADGSEVVVSTDGVPINFGDQNELHFVRLLQYKKSLGRKDPDVYIVFDATEDSNHVLVKNPKGLRVESGDDSPRGVYTEGSADDVYSNEQIDVAFVEDIILKLQKQHDEKRVKAAVEKARSKQERSLRNRWDKAPFRYKNMSYDSQENVEFAVVIGAVAALVGGMVFGISKLPDNASRLQNFDELHQTIESGASIGIESSGSPEFNFDLLHNQQLSQENVPDLLNDSDLDRAASGEVHEIDPVDIDGLRQIELDIDGGVTELAFPVHFSSQEDTIRAWTDYLGNTQDIEVEVGLDRITIRYTGDVEDALLNGEGMIRLVLQRVEPVQVPYAPVQN